ncbi:hypothetical protein PPERSA_12132 [Pseudocohnilembus persalinus]|uniref:Uncharacterized protein n=1 Tax=Pseudocohnilembus persalinus TaxID=266149 RepID=A0A0V0QP37_PSEPJ|nr:hypothetical protein PPERSA_12132 [Pseudocohnilembus persalinus]|eukprot:KRX03927.1 hypothetical protein PPERSA_12132 [Pseudocohnilembus persalinus]
MKPSKPFSLKKNTNKPLFNKEQYGDNNVLEQSNDNQEQSVGQYGINKPNFGVKKSYEKPFISSQQQKIQEIDEDELLNNKPKNKGPTLRKPGNSRLGQRPTQNISSNKNLIQQQINTDNLDENALLNTKPNMIKPNFKKKNPSIHNQQQNQQFSDSNQNNNFNISAQEQQVPINKSTLVNNRPQLLSKNREKKFIPTMEPIQRQEPENIQYQQKQQQQQIDPEDYQKFQQTVSQPFGPGAKNKLFKPKINPEEALKKAQKDVFGKDINPQMSYENRNLYKEKQEKYEQNQKQYLNQQKQAFEQKNQPFIPDQQKQTQYEQQQMQKEREKLQKQQQLEQEKQERSEYEKRQQQLYDQAQQRKQIQINNSSLVRPNLGKNKKIDWEKHEEQLSNQQYQQQQQQQQQRQKRQQQIQIDDDVSGGPASGQQIQEQNDQRQFNNNQQQNEQQYQKNQDIYNNEDNQQKQQVYDENYEYQAQDARGQYEVYINKIKSGAIKNSGDNCKPEQQEMDLQTDPIQNNDFGNQAPDDELRTFLPNLNQNEIGTSTGDFNNGGGINELNNLNQAKNLVDF